MDPQAAGSAAVLPEADERGVLYDELDRGDPAKRP